MPRLSIRVCPKKHAAWAGVRAVEKGGRELIERFRRGLCGRDARCQAPPPHRSALAEFPRGLICGTWISRRA
ncbi:hypothetical protein WCLP8_5150008 [uncultured Gammaproteobacteria bacterium]